MLSEKIKELREAHGLTQEELATALGLSRPTITKYERNERVPDLIIATRMAEYFGVSLDYLVGRKPSIKEKIAYEIVAMFNRKGLTDADVESNGFKTLLKLLNCVTDVYCNSNRK
jgi:transcriptional regulator with XRE-family HTH domain